MGRGRYVIVPPGRSPLRSQTPRVVASSTLNTSSQPGSVRPTPTMLPPWWLASPADQIAIRRPIVGSVRMGVGVERKPWFTPLRLGVDCGLQSTSGVQGLCPQLPFFGTIEETGREKLCPRCLRLKVFLGLEAQTAEPVAKHSYEESWVPSDSWATSPLTSTNGRLEASL
jgi:hypothetical protein